MLFWSKTSSFGGGREGKSKHFTKQIASFSSVRTDNVIGAGQKIPNCWLRSHFWGKVETAGRLTIKPRLGIMALVQVMPSGVSNFLFNNNTLFPCTC